jgi:hypothetical protein
MIENPGLIPDTRSQIDKDKDYVHDEVAPQAVALNWDRGIEGAPTYSIRDQNGSSSCVGQATAKALEIITGTVQSAHPIYRRRNNYPNLGMWLQDAGNIVRHLGTTSEEISPSQKMSELEMNKDIFVETPIKQAMYITANFKDIDTIAMAIETQKHCVLTIQSNYAEWDVEKPKVSWSPITFGHAICGVYYFKDENGEKCILIDESWGASNIRRRILTESFIKARGTGALYFIPIVPTPPPTKPKFTFSSVLEFGQNNFSIKMLQDILKYEGFFPTATTSTGYYGEITRKCVLQWQIKHDVAPMAELNALQGKRVGQKTIAKLNSIYSK